MIIAKLLLFMVSILSYKVYRVIPIVYIVRIDIDMELINFLIGDSLHVNFVPLDDEIY